MSVRCPRCGGSVAWSMGVWECLECGYKFELKEKPSLTREEYVKPAELGKEPVTISEPSRRVNRWILFSIVFLLIGLLSGYVLGGLIAPTIYTMTATKWSVSTVTTTQINIETLTTTTTHTTTYTVTQITTPQQSKTEQYNLEVLEVALDSILSEDYDYYIMTIKAEYTGGESWNFHPFWITLFSNAGYGYVSELVHEAIRKDFPSLIELRDGESIVGQVAFRLPKNEVPDKLKYDDEFRGILIQVTELPEPTKQISYIYFCETKIVSNYLMIMADASKTIERTAFYTGEDIEVSLRIHYKRFMDSPKSITVESIVVDKFDIVEMSPKLPVVINDDEETEVRLILKVPDEGYEGNLKITVYA